jgi:hypothetical protein
MAFNVSEFRANMVGDGARANLFDVALVFPLVAQNAGAATTKITFQAKTAQLPGSTIGTVPLYYFGRELKFAGNRTFPDWTLTIINDEDFVVRNALESWLDSINSHTQNIRTPNALTPSGYSADALVTQYSKLGVPIKQYDFVGLFPVDLSPIDVDWGANDAIEEYTVTFAYQYWQDVGVSTAATTT